VDNGDLGSEQRFHERLGLPITQEEARRRFMARATNLFEHLTLHQKEQVIKQVAFETGDPRLGTTMTFLGQPVSSYVAILSKQIKTQEDLAIILSDWEKTLIAIEALYQCVSAKKRQELAHQVEDLIKRAEVDLGIEWRNGQFWKKGARLLDDVLVHEPLEWLANASLDGVRRPFTHGLRLYRMAGADSEMLKSAVASMYEAVEATAKLLTKSDKDLSALKQRLAKALGLPKELRQVLDSYVEYGCKFRHADAVSDGARRPRPHLGEAEAEFFLYLTGLLLRLGTRRLTESGPPDPPTGSQYDT